MSLDVRLYSSNGYLLLLSDSDVYGIREGSALGMPATTEAYAAVWGRGFHPPVGYSYGNRVANLTLKVRGASLDGWVTNIQQLQQTLLDAREYWAPADGEESGRAGAQAYMRVQLNGMTNVTEWDILGGIADASALFRYTMTVTTAPTFVDVPLTLLLKPHGRPQQRTRTVSGTLNNGGGTGGTADAYTLSAPAGQVAMPLRVAVQSAAGDTFRRVLLGRKTGGNVANFIFALECETGTYTGYTVTDIEVQGDLTSSNQAVAAAHGGNVRRFAHAAGSGTNVPLLQWTINDNISDFYGTYRVLLRVDQGLTNITSFRLTYGGSAGTDIANAAVTVSSPNRTDYFVDLGRMTIPHRGSGGRNALSRFDFTLQYTYTNAGANNLDLDCIYLLPIDGPVLDIEFSAEASAQDQLVSDGLLPAPETYLLDSSGNIQPELQTVNADGQFTAKPQEDSRWFPLLLRGTGTGQTHDLTDQLTLEFQYFPLYELVR